uniref:Uncharacterized protein n=1 Tax=Anguilla anguilla TaxID=7936 RepID=A0A0E9TGH4_ANGAN
MHVHHIACCHIYFTNPIILNISIFRCTVLGLIHEL